MIAEVIINSSVKKLDKTFDYNIPIELKDKIKIGSRVFVPFGKNKSPEEGIVISIKENTEYKVRDIAAIQEEMGINEFKINLAKNMSKRYFCNIYDCIKLMLPPGTTSKEINNRIKEKTINLVSLKKDFEEINYEIEIEKIKSEKQIRILNFLNQNGQATISEIEMFTGASRSIVKTLEKNGYLEILEEEIVRNPFINKNIERDKKLNLTDEQKIAFKTIQKSIDDKKYTEALLYGVTGSGKTEVYLQLIDKVLENGKSAIILVPEISLTPQMVDRFIARFGEEKIAVLHSKLSVGERYDQWKKIEKNEAKIIIGARSAIFAPVKDIGLIIIDEEHDLSYKSETTPRYNAKDIAKIIAKQYNIPLILGSATPDLTTYYMAKNKEIDLLKLSKRANNSCLPKVEIVDLRQELANGNRSMISAELYSAIKENLENRRQTILFLNRRGFSTFIMCRNCGYTVKCKNCNISMTYHRKDNKLKCHYCGNEENVVTICPECKSDKIRYFGTGTQKLESEINKIFPEARTIRMDIDTVTKKNSHEIILNKFKKENIDILIGTQMVVKGHHFPNVTLVGVIAADSSLNIDDFRASERTFNILTQVAGRAGRENLPGKVIIQTYNPDNFSIQYAKDQNYDLFYDTEINLREQLKYPPFCDIIMFVISGKYEQEVKEISNKIYKNLEKKLDIEKCLLTRPTPSPIDKIKNNYRWRIIIKCRLDADIVEIINNTLNEYYEMNYKDSRVIVDINPTNML